jgi:hypothetical protein
MGDRHLPFPWPGIRLRKADVGPKLVKSLAVVQTAVLAERHDPRFVLEPAPRHLLGHRDPVVIIGHLVDRIETGPRDWRSDHRRENRSERW